MIIIIINCQLINLANPNSTNKIEEVSAVSFKACFKVKMLQVDANINHTIVLKDFPNILFIQKTLQHAIGFRSFLMPLP